MNVFDTLEKENATIRNLLGKLVETSPGRPEHRRDLFLEISARLRSELRAEEAHLYPLLLEFPQTRDRALQCRDDAASTRALLAEMAATDPDDPRFERLIERLNGQTEEHWSREERELFPTARQVVPHEQAERLGDRLLDEMRRLRGEGGRGSG